jgi:hypothetical protein
LAVSAAGEEGTTALGTAGGTAAGLGRGSGVNNSNRRKTDKGSNDGRHYLIYFISPWIFYCE